MRRRKVLLPITVLVTVGLAFGLFWFQPWKLFVDHRVEEALPTAAAAATLEAATPAATLEAATPAAPATPAASGVPAATPPDTAAPSVTSAAPASPTAKPGNVLLARGSLITHEHDTSGKVRIVELADGSPVLTLQDLDTSDGPDVEVWLTDAPVIAGEKGWYVFDDGAHVNLGDLKGNQGDQVYKIPRGVELSKYTSVSLWCARFDVSFGAAALRA